MTDFAALLKPDRGQAAQTIHVVDRDSYEGWAKTQSEARRAMLSAIDFDPSSAFQFAILQGKAASDFEVVTCVSQVGAMGPWCLAKLGSALPPGCYRLSEAQPGIAALGWLLAQHRFTRYQSAPKPERGARVLLTNQPAEIDRWVRLAEATALVRDMVDTPAADMGPAELETAARDLAAEYGATVRVTSGDSLRQDYPLIAAVGAAAARGREPRLIEIEWGKPAHPHIAIVGKGVCFDTGGLDIKPAAGMRLMKKDMGGAAHALALARLVMGSGLAARFHLLIPAVENAISGAAYRPGDIVTSREGVTVEIDNTDAEGRLVLADAFTRAAEDEPELLIDFATLTGAARIALGPELPALYVNDDALAGELLEAAGQAHDPVWRMPLWDNYDDMLKSDLADFANSGDTPMAGSITAALFLRRFVPSGLPWAHLDTFAWSAAARPGRPKGGEALGLRAIFALLEARYAAK